MNEKARHKRAYSLIRKLVKPFFKWKFNYEHPLIEDIEGPYIVLANHNLELDPVLVAMAFPKHMYFVASEHIMRKGFGTWFLMYFLKPIIRVKGKVEVKTVSEILRTLRGGDNVCVFAEGARSFNGLTRDILPSTGKMVRRSGATLITYRLEGGYFTQPRWSTTLRRSKMKGVLAGVYTAEALQTMSEAEVNAIIARDLQEDAYETQKKEQIPFKGKHLALGLESTLFICPECKQIGTLKSNDSSISCSCGASFTYTEMGELVDTKGNTHTITEWDLWQQRELAENYSKWKEKGTTQPCFSDDITLYDIDKDHQLVGEQKGTLTAFTDRLECCGHTFFYEDMLGLDIFSRNFMVMNYGKDAHHYEMKGDLMLCALKYLYLYELAKGDKA